MVFSLQSPIEGIPIVPNGSRLYGHLNLLAIADFAECSKKFAVDYADEKGRVTFYMGPTSPSLSVLLASDVQTLLKSSVHRSIFSMMKVHTQQFLGDRNVALLSGHEWKKQRSTITKSLHGADFIDHNNQAIVTATNILVDALKTKDSVPDMAQTMKMLTLDIFGQTGLHTDFQCCRHLQKSRIAIAFEFLANEMGRRMKDILNPASMFYSLPTAANRKHAEERQYLRNFVAGIVQKRKDQLANHPEEAPTDLLTNLIRNSSEEDKLSEESLSDTLMVLLLAGYETTSVTMTYVLYMLSQHPRVKKECLEEIDAGVEELVYLRAVITETLRLYPPVISTTRSSEREISLDGINIPKGTYLYFPIWWIQRDERNFERPLEFIPERWTRKSSGQASLFSSTKWVERKFGDGAAIECGVQAGNPGAFVAFSAGARSCAGQRFAMQEMTTALSILLKHFEFEPPEDYELVPYRSGVVQTPKGGLPMKIIKRDHK